VCAPSKAVGIAEPSLIVMNGDSFVAVHGPALPDRERRQSASRLRLHPSAAKRLKSLRVRMRASADGSARRNA
jgi:hypothetical protein